MVVVTAEPHGELVLSGGLGRAWWPTAGTCRYLYNNLLSGAVPTQLGKLSALAVLCVARLAWEHMRARSMRGAWAMRLLEQP